MEVKSAFLALPDSDIAAGKNKTLPCPQQKTLQMYPVDVAHFAYSPDCSASLDDMHKMSVDFCQEDPAALLFDLSPATKAMLCLMFVYSLVFRARQKSVASFQELPNAVLFDVPTEPALGVVAGWGSSLDRCGGACPRTDWEEVGLTAIHSCPPGSRQEGENSACRPRLRIHQRKKGTQIRSALKIRVRQSLARDPDLPFVLHAGLPRFPVDLSLPQSPMQSLVCAELADSPRI
mmetsp:Transcript_25531/g.60751  ORF Transcript_25531/g.60751 Transcript_25531/m.60751 type:complete len:234 (-) Transcript_25531:1742-2443(-)